MKPASATPQLSADVALGVIAIDVAAAAGAVEAAEPVWRRITPRGSVTTRDGRRYTFEPERLVARFATDGIDVPIDLDHGIALRAKLGERADAVGWIKELQARADGTYARIELLDAGEAALADRTHRFVSPTFHHDQNGLATWLHSVALVAAPALAMPAVAAAASNPENTMLKAVAKVLGLAETADEAACLAAVGILQTSQATLQASTVDKAVHDQALANLAAAQTQLAELQATDRKTRVDGVIAAALVAKKILPAQKDHYVALCATDEGLAQVERLIAATPAGLQASALDQRAVPDADRVSDPVTLAAKAVEHQKKLADSGQTISIADAVVAVAAQEGRQ